MPDRAHNAPACLPAAFELITGDRSMRYAGVDDVLAAASIFGGRWRVTSPKGAPWFSLAPVGAPGSDDREVIPHQDPPVATIMRDRRRGDAWVVRDPDGTVVMRAILNGAYEVTLVDGADVLVGRVFATSTSMVVELGTPPTRMPCLALALPLYFATTGALRVEGLDKPRPDLALWGLN